MQELEQHCKNLHTFLGYMKNQSTYTTLVYDGIIKTLSNMKSATQMHSGNGYDPKVLNELHDQLMHLERMIPKKQGLGRLFGGGLPAQSAWHFAAISEQLATIQKTIRSL